MSYFLKKAYGFLQSNYTELKETNSNNKIDSIILSIYDILNKNMGFLGAATGQFIDICPMNAIMKEESYKKYYTSVENILDLIYLKTTTFFEIGFLPAYLLSLNREATSAELEKVHKLVKYFGLAFQISDDLTILNKTKIRNSEHNQR